MTTRSEHKLRISSRKRRLLEAFVAGKLKPRHAEAVRLLLQQSPELREVARHLREKYLTRKSLKPRRSPLRRLVGLAALILLPIVAGAAWCLLNERSFNLAALMERTPPSAEVRMARTDAEGSAASTEAPTPTQRDSARVDRPKESAGAEAGKAKNGEASSKEAKPKEKSAPLADPKKEKEKGTPDKNARPKETTTPKRETKGKGEMDPSKDAKPKEASTPDEKGKKGKEEMDARKTDKPKEKMTVDSKPDVTKSAKPKETATDADKEKKESETKVPARPASEEFVKAERFLKTYCVSCHGPDKAKGDLRLDTLGSNLSDGEVADTWKKVQSRVDAGSMPPKGSPKPKKDEVAALNHWLIAELAALELAEQKRHGRAVLRRLNRSEYQNTLRDILGTDVGVNEYLPEDAASYGFDNVATAQRISPLLMASYLEAADRALDRFFGHPSAVPQLTKGKFYYGKEPIVQRIIKSQANGPNAPGYYNWFMPYKDDGAVCFHCHEIFLREFWLNQFVAKFAGEYKIRVAMSTYQFNGKIPVTILGGSLVDGEYPGLGTDYLDVTSDQPQTFEFTRYLPEGGRIAILPEGMWIPEREIPSKFKGRGTAIYWYEVEGPLPGSGPYPAYKRLIGNTNLKKGTLRDVENILRRLLPLAFRRPVSDADVAYFVGIARSRMKNGSFMDGLRAAMKAVLCAPEFLFFFEEPGPLDDYAVATRLSYFLWSAPPDDDLYRLAAKKMLRSPEVLDEQVERMLASRKAAAFTENFLGQWLELRRIDATVPDPNLYREYDKILRLAMLKETRLFFEEILKNDLSLMNFVDSDFAMLNRRLAFHYGIKGADDLKFLKVKLPANSHRGGLLTQASMLKVTANGSTTSPILRGTWVLKNILGQPLPAPPANVSALVDTRGAKTLRQQMSKHRNDPSCASCHRKIDPVGFALESFDVIGGWREQYRTGANTPTRVEIQPFEGAKFQVSLGMKVEVGDVMPNGKRFRNIDQFKKLLFADPEPIARNLAEKLTIYATGSPPSVADASAIDEMVKKIEEKNAQGEKYGLRSLVHAVVQSRLFLTK